MTGTGEPSGAPGGAAGGEPGGRPVVLVLRALGLGDFLTGVPAYRALRRAYPDHELVLAAPAELSGLVRLCGAIDRVLPARGLAPIRPTAPPPAIAVNLHGKGPRSHQLLAALRPGRLLAFAHPELPGSAGPPWRPDRPDPEHEVHRWCRMLGYFGVPADPQDLELPRPPQPVPGGNTGAPGPVAVVHPGAGVAAKRWPAGRFAGVARALQAAGYQVVVTGSAAERVLAARVAAAADLSAAAVLAGRTGLVELAGVVAGAAVVVAGDTGIVHLATAYGTPSVALFGPTASPREWGPPAGRRQHRVLLAGDLRAIGVGDVVAAVAEVAMTAAVGPTRTA